MSEYCLTTSVLSGNGSIKQPGCDWEPHGPNLSSTSCAAMFEEGTTITIMATPDSGWEVSNWTSNVPGVFLTSSTVGASSVSIKMPSSDLDIQVSFSHGDVTLILDVGGGSGCILLLSPSISIPCSGTTMSLPAGEIRVGANADSGWTISGWELDGSSYDSTNSYVDFSLIGYNQRKIVVYFSEEEECNTNNLYVTIIGNGSVSPPNGPYCDTDTKVLSPIPSSGYFFKEWQHNYIDGVEEDGVTLLVDMNIDRYITAIFEQLPSYEFPDYTLFYCPSHTYKQNSVSFIFTNDILIDNPSISGKFHFRATFYADAEKEKVVYSTFSFVDNKRWFYEENYFYQMPLDGLTMLPYETVTIIYEPEVLPSVFSEDQRYYVINETNTMEKPLACGVKYYVDIEVYEEETNTMTFLETVHLIIDCKDVESFIWNYNQDKNNWICSGQGADDLKISTGKEQSINPAVKANDFGIFQIVWEDRRPVIDNGVASKNSAIYSAIWDSKKDILYSSGQNLYDRKELKHAYSPYILKDQGNNFYITGHLMDSICFKAYPFAVSFKDIPTEAADTVFKKFCRPGLGIYLDSSYDQVKARIYNEDISGSLVINNDKVVPVINKKSIRLDIEGVNGAYAVRLRNIDDNQWGDWINIGPELYYEETESITKDDLKYDAYKIDNSRFIVNWELEKINGLRRICCQVLTLYGITNAYCVEFFSNFDICQNIFKFYVDSDCTKEFPTYKGQYVLSIKDQDGNILEDVDTSTVYFEAIFSEEIYKDEDNKIPYSNGDIKYNVIQQGTNDIWSNDGLISTGDNKTFRGQFNLYKDDGVFNKDGRAFIKLIFPDINSSASCVSNDYDLYNVMLVESDDFKYKDLDPDSILQEYKTSQVFKLLDINEFKQYYDKDDINFKFGDPEYFKKL